MIAWGGLDKLLPDFLINKYEQMNDEEKMSFYVEKTIFDTFAVSYTLQMVNINNEDLNKLMHGIYESLKNDSTMLPIFRAKFFNQLGAQFPSATIDIHPDVVMSEFEKHLRDRFNEYYEIMGGIGKLEQYRLEQLASKATDNIYSLTGQSEDLKIKTMGKFDTMGKFGITSKTTIDILSSEKKSSGCLSVILLLLIPSFIFIL